MKKSLITLAICTTLVIAGILVVLSALGWQSVAAKIGVTIEKVGVSLASQEPAGRAEAKANNGNPNERAPNVNVRVLQLCTLEDTLNLTGTVEPWQDVVLSAETPGRIEWRDAEAGQSVTEGMPLFRVDTESLQAMLDQAQAQLKLAGQELERSQRLLDRGAGTPQKQDSAVANRDVADANVRALQIRVRKSVIKSPFAGVIDRVFVKKDEFTDVGKPLIRLVQLHKVKVELGVPEREILHFKLRDPVKIRLDAIPDRQFAGTIHEVAPTADMTTHTFKMEIEVDNPDGLIKPGMIARIALIRGSYANSIVIPLFASALIEDKRFVFVENAGKAEMREIETGVVQGSTVQVTKGLAPGDHLIVVGQRDVRPGEPVKVQETLP